MTIATPEIADVPLTTDYVPESERSPLRKAWIFCRRQPLGTFGMVLVVIMAIAGICAEWIAPYSPTANDFSAMTEPPSWTHWLGTDQFGRDIFSRCLEGLKASLRVALLVGVTACPASAQDGKLVDSSAVKLRDDDVKKL